MTRSPYQGRSAISSQSARALPVAPSRTTFRTFRPCVRSTRNVTRTATRTPHRMAGASMNHPKEITRE